MMDISKIKQLFIAISIIFVLFIIILYKFMICVFVEINNLKEITYVVIEAKEINTDVRIFEIEEASLYLTNLTFENKVEEEIESVFYTEQTHPCFTGYEFEFEHTWLHEDYTCDRCGEQVDPRYGFTDEEIYLLAQLLCGGENINGDGEYDFVYTVKHFPDKLRYDQIGLVLCVVMNRIRSDQFPNTVADVVMQNKPVQQFIVMPKNAKTKPHDLAIEIIGEWCSAYDRYLTTWGDGMDVQNIPENHLYFRSAPNITNVSSTTWRR